MAKDFYTTPGGGYDNGVITIEWVVAGTKEGASLAPSFG
jgi:hypothetical protein